MFLIGRPKIANQMFCLKLISNFVSLTFKTIQCLVGRGLLEAGVWGFMSILVLLHWIKVGNDKLTMEKIFVRHFSSKG